MDEGSALALRALGYGTAYAVLGTGLFCFGVWKLSGAKDVSILIYLDDNDMNQRFIPFERN